MQIDESGKNSRAISSIYNVRENQERKNTDKISGESFRDRLQKNLPRETAGISSKDAGSGSIRIERCQAVQKAKEVPVRNIPYSDCDKVEIHVLEGFTLKAKLDTKNNENQRNTCRVYVEMKDEAGSRKAYLFDAHRLQKNSRNAMERIAYEVIDNIP